MSDRSFKVGIFGTFDVENWGDLLFPLLAQRALSDRLVGVEVIPFSYRGKTAADWFYEVTSLDGLPRPVADLDAILVGGGHLIRFDKEVAPGYVPGNPLVHHPTAYWLLPALLGIAAGVPVVWNGPSASADLPAWAEPLLNPALRYSAYVAVRDAASREELLAFAPGCQIDVVPDTAFGITGLIDTASPSPEFESLVERNGIRRPYILLQASDRAAEFAAPIHAARAALPDYQIVEIEIGPEIGDRCGCYDDWGMHDHTKVSPWPSPSCLAELVAHSSGAIATSLHLSVASIAFGHPVLRPREKPASKYAPLEEHGSVVPMKRKEPEGGEVFAQLVKDGAGSGALPGVLDQVAAHWDRVAALVRSGRGEPVALGAPEFLLHLPFYLETVAGLTDRRDPFAPTQQ